MKYTIYKITNKINGKVYIGKHQTKNPYDNYMGSGKAIKHAIKEYGRENFEKEVLFIFDTVDAMNSKEKELVNEVFISTNKTYNLGIGGEGGPQFLGKTHSEETKKKLSNIQRGKLHSDETKKKISDANFRRGGHNDETKRKLSEKAKERWSDKNKREEHSIVMKKYNSLKK
jgi:group I intron endonuclease